MLDKYFVTMFGGVTGFFIIDVETSHYITASLQQYA
jgi:hypothetical protein